jgi:iron complex transport system permease protein
MFMNCRMRSVVVLPALVFAGGAALWWALVAGEVSVSLGSAFATLFGASDGIESQIVRELRLPRAVAAFVCGGLLATAGALMQVLLRNPLADPYILGISGGAAVASRPPQTKAATARGRRSSRTI